VSEVGHIGGSQAQAVANAGSCLAWGIQPWHGETKQVPVPIGARCQHRLSPRRKF